ncbi:MAG: chalcone isomerase family protein [Wenzhouxiangellaceae bacterium]|nr:chalcone isomerase family protein [Wenzhouxiangellaceae bacterium]
MVPRVVHARTDRAKDANVQRVQTMKPFHPFPNPARAPSGPPRSVGHPGLPAAAVALTVALLASPADALDVKGLDVPESLKVGESTLVLNGAGMREKMFFDIYVACLYLQQPEGDPESVLAADRPQAITLHMTSELVTNERLKKATLKGLRKSTDNNIEPIRPQIDQLLSMFDKGQVAEGDVFRLAYLPGHGLRIFHNDELLGTIEGLRFKKALFGIWLSNDPAQESLKRKMLSTVESD